MNLDQLKAKINRLSQTSLARNTLWMLFSQGLRVILQAVYFVMLARALGAEQYGAFVGVVAFAGIVAPFASWGSGHILIKHVSRNRALFNEYWGNALFMAFSSGIVLLVLVLLGSPIVLPRTISPLLVFLVCLSDLIFLRILDTAGQAFQAVHALKMTAQINILLSLKNVIAVVILTSFFPKSGINTWAYLYLLATVISALIAFFLVNRMLGTPKLAMSRIKPEITQGFYFSVSLSAQTIYNDIDKTMLASLSTLGATGIYAAAYRLIDVSFVPIRSILYAAYAKFFQQGASGITGSLNLAKRLSPIAGFYGALAGIALFVLAPVVPYILGDEYANAVEALRWLAPLPFLKAMHYFAADTLTGAGFQGVRSAVQVGIAAFNVSINLWLIPLYSWKGAAWASLASDGLLMVSLWLMVAFFYRQQTQGVKADKS